MRRIHIEGRGRTIFQPLIVLSACIGLAACGSSSNDPSPNASKASTTMARTNTTTTSTELSSTGTTNPSKAGSTGNFPTDTTSNPSRDKIVQMVKCMHQNGIDLPEPDNAGNVNIKGISTNTPKYQTALSKSA
jgi:hypothetical protein